MKYAHFNAAANPSPVLSWISTDEGEWPKLPSMDYLIEVTPEQWDARFSQSWQVRDRRLQLAPSITLEQAKASKRAELTAAYLSAATLPVSYMGATFDADEWSQQKMIKAIASLGIAPSGFYWVDAANVKITMTLLQLRGLTQVVLSQEWNEFQKLQTRKTQANAAATVAAVQAITW